ncbi:MAG: response regulator transcription factor [Acidobacteria bacterium]|nr:response regulator transcription factor [Acidobacteriota bacterium]
MRILVIEDEHKVVGFIKKGLEAEQYAVDVASDGQCGLELALTYEYDLLSGAVDRSNQLQVADLVLDRISHQVTRAGKLIDLTAKEFALLEYLMTNAGQVCSRAMIIEHVWDQSFDSFTNVVDVYIRYLRNKIDRPFEPKLIQTVRGVGYVLREEGEQ